LPEHLQSIYGPKTTFLVMQRAMTKKLVGVVLFLAWALQIHAQTNFSDALRQKVRGNPSGPYSVDMVFAQPVYSPGDTVFFATTIWDWSASKPDGGRQIIDINLWNDKSTAEVSLRVLVFGVSNSQFVLPAKIKPGRYRLTASFYQSDVIEYQREFTVLTDWELSGAPYRPEVFVEGGHLIDGITNRIFVKNMAALPGRIKDSSGRTVKEFGGVSWTEIAMTPRNEVYAIECGGISIPMPIVEPQGFTMHLAKDEIEVRQKGVPPSTYHLVLIGKTGAEVIKKIDTNDSVSRIVIPQELSGVIQAAVVDEGYNVLASRWVKRSNPNVTPKQLISLEKKNYTTREKVHLKITGPSAMGKAVVRVIKKDLFQKYFEADGSVGSTLATLGPQPIAGLSAQKQPEKFLTIAGEAVYSDTGKPLPDSTVLVLFLQNKLFGYETTVFNGRFNVPLVFDVDGDETVFFSASFRKRDVNDFAIKLDTTLGVRPLAAVASEVTERQDAYGQYTIRKNVIDRSFRYFAGPANVEELDPNLKYIEELSGVDITVEPKQYVTFATMSEVIREILPSLEHRTIKDREVIRLYTTHKRPSNFANPLFIIDGVLTKNAAHFLDIAPADVLYIKIVKDYAKLRHFGLLGDNGIIIVRTRLAEPGFDQENVFPVEGMTQGVPSRIFNGNSFVNPRIPDLRPCLYWNPKAKFDDHTMDISFSTSDDVGDYVVQVYGRNANNEAFLVEQVFSVNLNK
jgi:hypothetical protein